MEQHKVLKSSEPDQLVSMVARQIVNHILDGIGRLELELGSHILILQEHNKKSLHSRPYG